MRREVREMEGKNQAELINRMKAERAQLKALPDSTTDEKNAKLNAIAQTDSTDYSAFDKSPYRPGRDSPPVRHQPMEDTASEVTLRDGDTLVVPRKLTS